MKRIVLALAVLALMVPMIQAQNYHPGKYLWNGYQTTSTSTIYWRGFYTYDNTTTPPTLTKLFDPPYYTQFGSACMDWDNKSFIFATSGTSSTGTQYDGASKIYRYDMATNTLNTIIKLFRQPSGTYPYGYQYCYDNITIDQNGDYLFSFYEYKRVNTPTTVTQYTRGVLKYDTAANVVSTVITTLDVPNPNSHYFYYSGVDIDTGKVWVTTGKSMTSPTTMRYPIITINPEDGYNPANVGLWNDGSVYGFNRGTYSPRMNHRNGNIEGQYYSKSSTGALNFYRSTPGSGGMTTIASITTGMPFPSTQYTYTGKFDLQTAAKPRWLGSTYYSGTTGGSALLNIDVGTWTVNSFEIVASPTTMPGINNYYPGQFDFLGGRHLQTVKISPNKWAVLISVPHLPGMPYVAVLGLSGVRPGIPLPSGRNININWDTLVFLSLNNGIPNLWNPGPLKLNANGEARASIDINPLNPPKGGFGFPVWIAVAVLDPKAPDAIAYLPDTYVIRL